MSEATNPGVQPMTTDEAIERLKRLEQVSYNRHAKMRAWAERGLSREHAADAEALRMAISALKEQTNAE